MDCKMGVVFNEQRLVIPVRIWQTAVSGYAGTVPEIRPVASSRCDIRDGRVPAVCLQLCVANSRNNYSLELSLDVFHKAARSWE